MPQSKSDEVRREMRRKKVAANLLSGLTYREIAEALNCSIGTVSNDVSIILGRWRREQVADADRYVELECRRLDIALNALWGAIQEGKVSPGSVSNMYIVRESP